MDIIDVMLARAMTPQGQIQSYAAQSQSAVAKANQAVSAINSITEQTNANNQAAQDALAAAATAMENAQAAEARIDAALESLEGASMQEVQDEIGKLAIQLVAANTANYNQNNLTISYPNNTSNTITNIIKMYKSTGTNEDGTMTQKAITDALSLKANSADVATKAYVDQRVSGISGGGVSNLGIDAAGKIVIVDKDGNITAGTLTEEDIADAIINGGGTTSKESLGLLIDYDGRSFDRVYGAANLVAGSDFNKFAMYGGRMRCNVSDDGAITAFYGDSGYTEDGSNGQVMIYQPKFYYQRIIVGEVADAQGRVVSKEQLLLSASSRVGFKLHPLFVNNGEELDYVLLPAYEGNIYDTSASAYILDNSSNIDINTDKLSSIAGTKPFVGSGMGLSFDNLRQLAANRGEGWQLSDIRSESALQMLFMIEFGSLNGQYNIGKGVVNVSGIGEMITGSTASLGNGTGRASSTTFINQNTTTQQTAEDKTAISYRGMENPWGDYWRAIDKIVIKGEGKSYGGIPYYNGTDSLDFCLPNMSYGWISNMGIGSADYDWVYMPIKCDNKGNSALPVGDSTWTTSSMNGTKMVFVGGGTTANESAGLFDYSCDGNLSASLGKVNGRIMFIPTKNTIYTTNINKWKQHYGG